MAQFVCKKCLFDDGKVVFGLILDMNYHLSNRHGLSPKGDLNTILQHSVLVADNVITEGRKESGDGTVSAKHVKAWLESAAKTDHDKVIQRQSKEVADIDKYQDIVDKTLENAEVTSSSAQAKENTPKKK